MMSSELDALVTWS